MANFAEKPNYDPINFSGEAKSIGFSQDIKEVVGAGWSVSGFSSGDWKGISVGASVGVGLSGNLGAVHLGGSSSILLNNVKKTSDRSMLDRALNANPVTAFPQAQTQYFMKNKK